MPKAVDFGGGSAQQVQDDILSVAVHSGDSVVVTNSAGGTFTYYSKGINGTSNGTVAAGSSVTLSTPGTHFLTSASRTSITLSGGQYGT